MTRYLIVDGNSLARRFYHATERSQQINSRGENVGALTPWTMRLLKMRNELKPEYAVVVWDGRGPTWRHRRFPAYKGTRGREPEDFTALRPAFEELAEACGYNNVRVDGVEADDVMATLTKRAAPDEAVGVVR